MITHHLDDATLMAFAAGDLDEAFAVVVASHISMCEDCKAALSRAESLGGVMLDAQDISDSQISETAFDDLMGAINANPPSAEIIKMPRAKAAQHRVPKALAHYVGEDLSQIKWKTVAPGLRKHQIKVSDGSRSSLYLLHIAPGMAVPEHGHGGDEITLILDGAYRDEFGYFGSGDVADLDDHVEHQPRVVSDVPCICLAATQEKTRFKDFIPRLLQPLIGI